MIVDGKHVVRRNHAAMQRGINIITKMLATVISQTPTFVEENSTCMSVLNCLCQHKQYSIATMSMKVV